MPNLTPQDMAGNGTELVWMTTQPAPKSIVEDISCKTLKKCNTKACPCQKNEFQCTHVCGCSAKTCENSETTMKYLGQDDDNWDLDI